MDGDISKNNRKPGRFHAKDRIFHIQGARALTFAILPRHATLTAYPLGYGCILKTIDSYLKGDATNFWDFYNWFQDAFFGDKILEQRKGLKLDEFAFLNEISDMLGYAGTDPTDEERNDGIIDQYEFQDQLKNFKSKNLFIWKRYGM